ncbi:MAG: DUF885 domain-containing protein, partial [Candidatus Eisenbacteria bacterium]|nr:DUF885 domain-containing protein [Candidatus Eisenbacteria bacterium]
MSRPDAELAFDRFADRVFDALLSGNPILATTLGIHGPHDSMLPSRTASAAQSSERMLTELLQEAESFHERELSIERLVDLRLVRSGLAAALLRGQKRPLWRVCPCSYVNDAVYGLYSLMVNDFAPLPDRASAVGGRLHDVPRLLDQGRANVENPSPVFTEMASLSVRGAVHFLDETVAPFLEEAGDVVLRGRLEGERVRAREAFLKYGEWLEADLMPRSNGRFAIGRSAYERLMIEEQGLRWTTDQLIALGQRIYTETLRESKRVASRLLPGKPWSRVFEAIKTEHPEPEGLLSSYAAEVARAKAFLQQHDLITIPEDESISIAATPDFARPLIPYAGYVGPAPFEGETAGTFWVTTPDPNLDEGHQLSQMKGHSYPRITVTSIHDGYPGHHVQALHANRRTDRKLRLLFPCSTMVEGWALYCEEMMYGQGFFRSEKVRLLQLRDLLWRACRVIIDIELQTGRMGFNEAVSFLVRKAHLERPSAVAEVRRHCAYPTQPMSYIAGKALIEELLRDYRAARGSRFRLREFHDDLLSHGPIPIDLIRLEMGIERRPRGGPGRAPLERAEPAR